MKQNGFRFVQRKFAQGVPIPASSISAAPPSQEKKPDPPYSPRNVYHNNMTARNLLDIVAMQNIHKHKQPMVLLERLREDEIPSPSAAPKIRVPLRKRRNDLRVDKNNMCLRSGKPRSPEAGKGPARKRKKLSSESTDDIPLVYYFSRPNPAKPHSRATKLKELPVKKEREKRTPTPTRAGKLEPRRGSDRAVRTRLSSADRSEDGSGFTFKEPSSPVRNYRIIKRKAVTSSVIPGQPLRKAMPKLASRRPGLRSAAPGGLGVPRRLRDKRLSAKKQPKLALRKTDQKPAIEDEPPRSPQPGPSGLNEPPEHKIPKPPPSESDEPLRSPQPGPSGLNEPPEHEIPKPPPSESDEPLRSPQPGPSVLNEPPEHEIPKPPPSESGSSTSTYHLHYSSRETTPALSTVGDMETLSIFDIALNAITWSDPPRTTSFDTCSVDVRNTDWSDWSTRVNENTPIEPNTNTENNVLEQNRDETASEKQPPEKSILETNLDENSNSAEKRRDDQTDEQSGSNQKQVNGKRSVEQKLDGEKSLLEEKREKEKREKEKREKEKREKEKNMVQKRPKKNVPKEKASRNTDWSDWSSRVNENTPIEPNTNTENNVLEQNRDETASEKQPPEKSILETNLDENSNSAEKRRDDQTDEQSGSNQKQVNGKRSVEQKLDGEKSLLEEKREKEKREKEKREKKKREKEKNMVQKRPKKNVPKEKARKPVSKPARAALKKAEPKNVSKTSQEDSSSRVLRQPRDAPQPPAPANPDVYEFDAELEASRPPIGLRARRQLRKQPTPKPPASPKPTQQPTQPNTTQPDSTPTAQALTKDKEVYIDVFPLSTRCVQIKPKEPAEECQNFLNISLVEKNICTKKKMTLLESSPSLLNKFLNCLSPEMHTQLDNLIAAEQAKVANNSNDPEASTSRQTADGTVKSESEGAVTSESATTYLDQKTGSVLEALTFYPTAEEFADPIKYYDKIAPQASKYGLCKIVPPAGFKPPCNMSEATRFAVIYQYISKMYSRWGPVSRELAAIKAHLRTQSVVFARSPLLDGSEVNLPKLYHAVERNGGLSNVIQRKRWGRVADEMKLTKLQHPERKLDPIYMRYLLPYATLSDQERKNIMAEVESCWTTKYQKMLERARNPFQRQNRMLGTECESESDDESNDNTAGALHEAEDCIVQGRSMNLATFKKIATSLMDAHFEPTKQPPSAVEVEKAYWRAVLPGTEHIVATTASIDTGEEGYGFPKDPDADYGTHPWNLKVLARNPNNVLRYLGAALGVTVPTLHLGMLFSTSCWHRDPHGLPWTEYMHSGAEKIWYGIPRDESSNFRRAVETLCPAYCQNKSIWLASEITMVPPNILSEHGVKLSRLLQRPGEYVLVFPEAHSCSITTGFAISESVYFASNMWLSSVYKLFQELRNSCEPTMFSLEQLLLNGSADSAAPQCVFSVLSTLLGSELEHRRALEAKGLKVQERPAAVAPLNTSYFRAWNAREQDECEYCRSTLFLSKVIGLTGRKSAVCPEHALRLLETKKYKNVDVATLEFLSCHSTGALEEMLERLDLRTDADSPGGSDARSPDVIDLTGAETPVPALKVENSTLRT